MSDPDVPVRPESPSNRPPSPVVELEPEVSAPRAWPARTRSDDIFEPLYAGNRKRTAVTGGRLR